MIESPADTERILIVDDLVSFRKFISHILTDKGYNCVSVADGAAALAILRKHRFALVLLHINIPGKSGREVLREISKRHPDMAVIMITSTDDAKIAIDMTKIGAFDYIIKPVNLLALLVRVNNALDKRRLLLENKEYQLYLEDKVRKQTEKIRKSFLNSITSLVFALEARDKYTSGHSKRVSKMALALSQSLGMAPVQTEKIKLAGLLHDVGKIGIRESVLLKQSRLTDEEYSHISAHSVIGERILRPIIDDEEILRIIRHHHERYDGKGYPDELTGHQIPQGARILSVADTYDAMTSDRPYRKALSPRMALDELERQINTQFDSVVVEAFHKIIHDATERGYEKQSTLVSP